MMLILMLIILTIMYLKLLIMLGLRLGIIDWNNTKHVKKIDEKLILKLKHGMQQKCGIGASHKMKKRSRIIFDWQKVV